MLLSHKIMKFKMAVFPQYLLFCKEVKWLILYRWRRTCALWCVLQLPSRCKWRRWHPSVC